MDACVMVPADAGSFGPLVDASEVPWDGGRQLARWWFAARERCPLPSLKDFDPRQMGRFLSGVIVVDVLEEGQRFRIRLAGEDHRLAQGWRLKGADLMRFSLPYPPNERLLWLVREKRPYMARDLPGPRQATGARRYSVVAFPLSEDGERVTAVIGHTKYE